MAKKRGSREYLSDILREIEIVETRLSGYDYERFVDDGFVQRGVSYALLVITEASRRLPDEIKASEKDVDWRSVAGFGNVLRHDYNDVDMELVGT